MKENGNSCNCNYNYNCNYNSALTAKINVGMWCRLKGISRIIKREQLIKTL